MLRVSLWKEMRVDAHVNTMGKTANPQSRRNLVVEPDLHYARYKYQFFVKMIGATE